MPILASTYNSCSPIRHGSVMASNQPIEHRYQLVAAQMLGDDNELISAVRAIKSPARTSRSVVYGTGTFHAYAQEQCVRSARTRDGDYLDLTSRQKAPTAGRLS
jgi:hypothetical protein